MAGKKNLQLELGTKYVTDFFQNALFIHEGKLCRLQMCGENQVAVHWVSLDKPSELWDDGIVPVDALYGFSKFQWPTLGYRQYDTPSGGIVVHATATRSAHRGLRPEQVHYEFPPVCRRIHTLMREWEMIPQTKVLVELFQPKFTPFTEGLKQLLAGKTAAFAVSPLVAVAISVEQSADVAYDIYFRQKVVGSVSEGGEVTLTNKVVQRDNVRAAIFG